MNNIIFLYKTSPLYKTYLKITLVLSSISSLYFGMENSLIVLIILIILDSITKINSIAHSQNIKFNILDYSFWSIIKSKGLKLTLNKAFMQYGIYFIIAFIIDYYILERFHVFNFNNRGYTLPVITLWLCSAIEIWSIGENIEEAGGINIPKKILHFLDEKYQKIFKKENESNN